MITALTTFGKCIYEQNRRNLQDGTVMRYLDDYFAPWSYGKENLEEFLQFVNQIDAKIQFTMEVEESEQLPFMDVEVIHSNETLKKKLYRKKSYSGIILNFRSHHNYRLMIGLMTSMIIQSLPLTDADFLDKELEKLTRILSGNDYPSKVLQRNITAVKSQWQNGEYERTVRTINKSGYACLPAN
ncbi:unnamed protein product [Protopolystoma xenopodis]|uniref:Helix-turn-helix domain-containing protein n=1 Tax=Protopolystoma xenopodis TaxID=117903 RepID=A0A3S5CML3_9PLAT|nr:unnamed protein product [Protopolystoma xenopodis]